jgi:hypothetical protein
MQILSNLLETQSVSRWAVRAHYAPLDTTYEIPIEVTCLWYSLYALSFQVSCSLALYCLRQSCFSCPRNSAFVIQVMLMDHWHISSRTQYQSSGASITGVLTTSSGNAQTYALDAKDGIENQDPFEQGPQSKKVETQSELHFPGPRVKLSSNDHYADNLLRLQARRQYRPERVSRQLRISREKPYLQHPKYIDYRSRPRCDTGKDGKPVWDDRVEEAFQNALANIEPMGRRKKSQRGRPHGRNELISEWIMQETGEFRSRKQVSSHIQVLNEIMKNVPEWKALVVTTEDGNGDRPNHEYHSDSIEQMVRSRNAQGSNDHSYRGSHGAANFGSVDKHSLHNLSFEMWVSLPNQMNHAQHIYSKMQNSNATSAPITLEEVKNWRGTFPDLKTILEPWHPTDSCDIIMLEASFRLMTDLPPRFSKLGISLTLDFLHPSNNNGGALAALQNWTCKTHMYQHGRMVKDVSHDDCHVAGPGKIRPFFESKWWASTFTQLTEKRKLAEASKNDGALELANEYCRNFFRGLTVMQEVFADMPKSHSSHTGGWSDQHPRRRRMAILLWRFSQAPSQPPNDYVGTTTWHKILPPFEKASEADMSSAASTDLPQFSMDTIMGDAYHAGSCESNSSFLPTGDTQYSLYTDDQLYQDNLMAFKTNSMAGFDDAVFDCQHSQMELDSSVNIGFDLPTHDLNQLPMATQSSTANLFEPSHPKQEMRNRKDSIHTASQHDPYADDGQLLHQPLDDFNLKTHHMLQAQVGHNDDPFCKPPTRAVQTTQPAPSNLILSTIQSEPQPATTYRNSDDEALRSVLLAASTMSNLGNMQQSHSFSQTTPITTSTTSQEPLYIPTSRPFTFPTDITIRSSLQSNHSFAGITSTPTLELHTQTHEPRPCARVGSKDFETVLTNLHAYNITQEMSFMDFNNDDGCDSGIGIRISRPQSQPVLMSGAVDVLYEEVVGQGAGTLSGQQQGQREILGSSWEDFSRVAEESMAGGVGPVKEAVAGGEGEGEDSVGGGYVMSGEEAEQ